MQSRNQALKPVLSSREDEERYLLELRLNLLRQQQEERAGQPHPHDWGYSYADHPREFMREIIGQGWDTPAWQSWRAFISAVFVQPIITAGEWRTFQNCTALAQQPIRRPPSVWMPVGRRGGKSRMLAAIAVYLACCYDWSHHLVPGELGVLPILAQDRRSARTIMSYIKAFLAHPNLAERITTEQIESILLDGKILIEVVTASFRAVRNRTVIAALLDEIAFWRSDEDSANPDKEIIDALEPAMATIPNALILAASSPYARRGVLWDNYQRHYGKAGGPLIWKAATRVMNPTVPQSYIDEKYEEDPVAAAAEYGADFRSDVDAFVLRETLDAALMRGIHEVPFVHGTHYKAFVDPSGGSSDSMALAIGHVDYTTGRGMLDCLREVRAPFSPEVVVAEFVTLLRDYKVNRVRGDYYGAEWPRDRFIRSGIGYEVSKKRKSDIYLEFVSILNAGRCDLLDDRRMYSQFLNLERRSNRSGLETIDHASGVHDDVANVTAGVMVDLLGKRDVTRVDPGVLARSAMLIRPSSPRLGTITPRWG